MPRHTTTLPATLCKHDEHNGHHAHKEGNLSPVLTVAFVLVVLVVLRPAHNTAVDNDHW
jgi:hypothetical protein